MCDPDEHFDEYCWGEMYDERGDDDLYLNGRCSSNRRKWDPRDFDKMLLRYDRISASSSKAHRYEFNGKRVWLPLSRTKVVEQLHIVQVPRWLVNRHDLKGFLLGDDMLGSMRSMLRGS